MTESVIRPILTGSRTASSLFSEPCPKQPDYPAAEVHFRKNLEAYTEQYHLENKVVLVSSDAHYLTDLREENESLEIPDEPYSSALVRHNLIKIIRGEKL